MSDSLSFVSPQFDDDALLCLLSFLDDPLDLAHVFKTSWRLNKLTSNPQVWQRLLQKYFSQEVTLYTSVYKYKPFELFKNLYLCRLKQYYVAFGLKKCTKEDFLLFLNMTLGYIKEVDKLEKLAPQKVIKIYGFMMSQKNFEVLETKYGSSPQDYREKIYGQALIFCCRHNHPEELKLILERHPEYIDVSKSLESGLRCAAKLGHIECIDVLLECKKFVVPPQLLGELLISACTSNKKRMIDYFLTHQRERISDQAYGLAFVECCQHPQKQLEAKFCKKLTLQNVQSGILNALSHECFELAETLLRYLDLTGEYASFEKMCLATLAEKNALPGFLFIFKKMKTNLENVFISHLLRTAYQHDAFNVMRFLLNYYQDQLPSYLAHQAQLKLDHEMTHPMIEKSPTLIFSETLNNQIDLLSEQLDSLKIVCSSDENHKNSYLL